MWIHTTPFILSKALPCRFNYFASLIAPTELHVLPHSGDISSRIQAQVQHKSHQGHANSSGIASMSELDCRHDPGTFSLHFPPNASERVVAETLSGSNLASRRNAMLLLPKVVETLSGSNPASM